MTQKERIEQLLKESIDGTITAEEVTKAENPHKEIPYMYMIWNGRCAIFYAAVAVMFRL